MTRVVHHYGNREQRIYLDFLLGLELTEDELRMLDTIKRQTKAHWREHFEIHGRTPCETTALEAKRTKKLGKPTLLVSEETLAIIRDIIKRCPELFLDEIQLELCNRTGIFLSLSTLCSFLLKKVIFLYSHKLSENS